ncbi:MFS transporter [Levilactobacillus brevis]|uniref:MFS-type drug efflux transporter P55 n=1 Tax=Levilactobacillus brevis TaxID=1580 RepID=A0AA41EMS6_LEVBR|nr:MFS transporter [Levilactobacillus brevis]KID42985.1 hypothetical protein LbDm2_2075 [Levilactobacillus brevis]MBS0946401.1 MFS transporter [Levilactobacillus brevis]MBS0977892.1 MFS transporter [Levilactobacillus brevis]MBS1009747.1 MFS transporter [Levilactobacillus brevis]MCU0198689.1 MFS transporter [Levilactobacillus brevis]
MTETRRRIITFGLLLANIMAGFEGTIISTAMPTIVADLHGLSLMSWGFTIYFLFNAIGTPIWGRVADIIGRKRSFLFGTAIFVIGSLLEGLATNMIWLIIARGIMGIGAGGMLAIPFIIFSEIYPVDQRASVFGFTAAFGGISAVCGPLLGGWIIDVLNWHWVFFINIPIGIISILIVYFAFREESKERHAKIDVWGSLSLSIVILAFLLGVQLIGQAHTPAIWAIVFLLIAIVFGFLFVRIERNTHDPLIPLHLFKNKDMLLWDLMAFVGMGFYISFSVYIPMWAQGILLTSALAGGATQIPTAGLWYSGSRFGSYLSKKRNHHLTAVLALSFALISTLVLLALGMTPNYAFFIIVGALLGIALGMLLTTSQVGVSEAVTSNDLAVATTLNRLFNTLGQTIMTAIYGLVFNIVVNHQATKLGLPSAKISGLTNSAVTSDSKAQLLIMHHVLFAGIKSVLIVAFILLLVALVLEIGNIHLTRIKKQPAQ